LTGWQTPSRRYDAEAIAEERQSKERRRASLHGEGNDPFFPASSTDGDGFSAAKDAAAPADGGDVGDDIGGCSSAPVLSGRHFFFQNLLKLNLFFPF